jgi:hypothetical protein
MVLFRIILDLHNFDFLQKNIVNKNKKKAKYILEYYKALGKMIVYFHNSDINNTRQYMKKYYEPYIKLNKNLFVFRDIPDNISIKNILNKIFPPSLELDIEFTMNPIFEKKAIKTFSKLVNNKDNNITNYKDLRILYYSTKITNFVNNLNNTFTSHFLWNNFIEKYKIKTKYIPNITVNSTSVLSLN